MLSSLLLSHPLGLQNNALKLFKNWEVLVGVVDLGIALAFTYQKADFLHALELALDVAGILLNKLGQTSDMRLKVRIFGIDHNDLAPHPRCNEGI